MSHTFLFLIILWLQKWISFWYSFNSCIQNSKIPKFITDHLNSLRNGSDLLLKGRTVNDVLNETEPAYLSWYVDKFINNLISNFRNPLEPFCKRFLQVTVWHQKNIQSQTADRWSRRAVKPPNGEHIYLKPHNLQYGSSKIKNKHLKF